MSSSKKGSGSDDLHASRRGCPFDAVRCAHHPAPRSHESQSGLRSRVLRNQDVGRSCGPLLPSPLSFKLRRGCKKGDGYRRQHCHEQSGALVGVPSGGTIMPPTSEELLDELISAARSTPPGGDPDTTDIDDAKKACMAFFQSTPV